MPSRFLAEHVARDEIFSDDASGDGCDYNNCRADAEAIERKSYRGKESYNDIRHQPLHRDGRLRVG